MMHPLLKIQLHLLRGTCLTVVAAIDMSIAAEEAEQPAPPAEEKVFSRDPDKCQHPRSHWLATPTMGHANRVTCQCGTTMEE